jgi:5'-methylthioadenosine phosphorylase
MSDIEIAVIGGSGLYEMEELEIIEEHAIDTPFGPPSDDILIGRLHGRKVAFLPRHGRGHRHNPSTIPFRANAWALKSLGVFWVISVSAVGSLKEEIAPRDFVVPDQIIDRTRSRANTLYDGLAVHVGFTHPFDPFLREQLLDAASEVDVTTHDGGTYVCMEGPLFSTRAESNLYRSWGASLIGMTAVPEAKFFREAEMSYASVCLATDYDVWKEDDTVDVADVMANVAANVSNVQRLLERAIPAIPLDRCNESDAFGTLEYAVMTDPDQISDEEWTRTRLFLASYVDRAD